MLQYMCYIVIFISGVHTPLLRVQANTCFIEFLGPNSGFTATSYSENLYGFKLYIIPEFLPVYYTKSLFSGNIATNGAGIYLYSGTYNTILLNVDFKQNAATINGGGVFWGSVHAGGVMQQVLQILL